MAPLSESRAIYCCQKQTHQAATAIDTCRQAPLFHRKPFSFGSLYGLQRCMFLTSSYHKDVVAYLLHFLLVCVIQLIIVQKSYTIHFLFLTHYLVVEGIFIMPLRLSELNMNLDPIMIIPYKHYFISRPSRINVLQHAITPIRKKSITPYQPNQRNNLI